MGILKNSSDLKLENELLKYKVQEQDKMLFDITQENAHLSSKVEELEQQQEINERLETDIDHYNTKNLDRKMYSDFIEKVADERNTYKEVINIICDKYNIGQDSVFNIIDSISSNKGLEVERYKLLKNG